MLLLKTTLMKKRNKLEKLLTTWKRRVIKKYYMDKLIKVYKAETREAVLVALVFWGIRKNPFM